MLGKTMGKPWENGDLYSNNDWLVVTGTIEKNYGLYGRYNYNEWGLIHGL